MKHYKFTLEEVPRSCYALISIDNGETEFVANVDWSYSIDSEHHVEVTVESVYTEEADFLDCVDTDALAEQIEAWCYDKLDLEAERHAMMSDHYHDMNR